MNSREFGRRLRVIGMLAVLSIAAVALLQFMLLSVTVRNPETSAFRAVALAGSALIFVLALVVYTFVLRKVEEGWQASRERFRSMFREYPDPGFALRNDGTIAAVNGRALQLCGYKREELLGRSIAMLLPSPELYEKTGRAEDLVTQAPSFYANVLVRGDKSTVPVSIQTLPIRTETSVEGAYALVRDITEETRITYRESLHRNRLTGLAECSARFATRPSEQIERVLEFAMDSLDAQAGHVGVIDGAYLKITHSVGSGNEVGFVIPAAKSYTRHMYGSTTVLAIEDSDRSPWREDPARETNPWQMFIGSTVFGGGRPVGLVNFVSRQRRPEPFDDSDRDFVRIVSSLVGAALERIRVERELEAAAFVDPVTGVPNRAYFMDHMRRALAQVDRQGGKTTMLFLDLDAFKVVNDRLGHIAGDEVLRVVATRLRSVLREEDVLARIGGDEFAVLQRTAQEEDSTLHFAERLVSAASEPIFVGGTMFTVGASVGIASYPRDATGAESLLNAADRAMYAAKAEGKGRARLFSSLL